MIIIRKFEEKDREAVRKICMDTAHKRFQKKQELKESIAIMFVDYWITYEPENCFVADNNGEICGYIVCSTNKELFQKQMKQYILPKVKKIRWWLGLFTKICIKQSLKMDELLGGGGFHMNIAQKYQGEKLGPKLLTRLGLWLKENNHKYLYLITASRKTRGYGFYTHYGFKEKAKCGGSTIALAFNLNEIEEKAEKYLN